MLVQEYLKTKSLEDLTAELGIQVRRHTKYPNLVGLCYWNVTSPHYHPIVTECRGLILDEANDWNVVAYPFDRFYNYGEVYAEDDIDFDNSYAYKKLDGSLIIMYHYNNEWLVGTTGSPDAGGTILDWDITFSELAWNVFNEEHYKLDDLDVNYTYMFELCTPFNKVVVPHSSNSLTLIGVRNRTTLREESIWQPKFNKLKLVESLEYGLTIDEVTDELVKLDGLHNEGYVIVEWFTFKRVKLKHDDYVKLHRIKFNTTKRDIIELVRTGEGNEFISYFPEFSSIYYVYLSKYNKLIALIEHDLNEFAKITDKKQFAIAISNIKWKAILFSIRDGRSNSIREALSKLLLKNFEELLESCK
jgi:hypothetical protein